MKTYRVSIPVLVQEEHPTEPRIIGDASEHLTRALMVGFRIEAPSPREAALILYERLEATCGDP